MCCLGKQCIIIKLSLDPSFVRTRSSGRKISPKSNLFPLGEIFPLPGRTNEKGAFLIYTSGSKILIYESSSLEFSSDSGVDFRELRAKKIKKSGEGGNRLLNISRRSVSLPFDFRRGGIVGRGKK